MTLALLLAGWTLLSLVTTAGMALVCHGGALQDRAQEAVALPVPRAAADDDVESYRMPSHSLTHR